MPPDVVERLRGLLRVQERLTQRQEKFLATQARIAETMVGILDRQVGTSDSPLRNVRFGVLTNGRVPVRLDDRRFRLPLREAVALFACLNFQTTRPGRLHTPSSPSEIGRFIAEYRGLPAPLSRGAVCTYVSGLSNALRDGGLDVLEGNSADGWCLRLDPEVKIVGEPRKRHPGSE